MAVQIDRLQTIIVATGQSAYRRAMHRSSAAVAGLGVAEALTAGQSAKLAAAQQGAAVAATEQAVAEGGAAVATTAAGGAASAANIAIAALTITVGLAVVAFAALTAATALVAGGAAKGLMDVTKAARDAEDALRKAAAVAGLNEKEISDLEDALPLDELSKLGFNAKDAGEALWFLFSAGLNTTEALETLGSVTLLASALNTDSASAAGLLVATMKALGIETKDAAAVVDGFAAVNAVTMASFEKLQNALIAAGPAARLFGIEFRDMLNILGQFFNVGLRGSMAGMAFRMGLIQLATATDQARAAMKKLGLDSDVAASLLSRPRQLIEYLATAQWDAASAATVFGARALVWQNVIAGGVETFDKLAESLLETGKAQTQADIAMGGLAGAVKILAADFENMKAKIGEVTQALSTDLVKGASLAARAFGEAFSEYINILKDSQGETLTTRDVILETALAIVEVMGYAAESGIILLEVWKKLAIAAKRVGLETIIATRLMTNPFADVRVFRTEIIATEEAWKSAGDASTEYRKHVAEVLERTRANIHRLRKEMEEEALVPGAPAELAAVPVPGIPAGLDATVAGLQEAAAWMDELRRGQEWLALNLREAQALTEDRLTSLALEVEYRRRNLEYAQAITAAVQYAASFEEDEAKAVKAVNAALAEQESARIAILEAEQAYRKAIIQMQEKAWKEADRERMKTARDYDRLIKKGDSVRDAIQAVIGGTLGRGIQEAIGRVSGAGLRQGLGPGAIRAVGTNEIRLVIDMPGIGDEGKRQIMNWILGVMQEGASSLQVAAN